MGNLHSVAKALEAAGANVTVTGETDEVEACDALCVPGQGIFGRCMDNLAARGHDALIGSWIEAGKPYLGICLGLQVLFDHSEEGDRKGLGILGGDVKRLPAKVVVPHIGWNEVGPTFYYFDHSFAAFPTDESVVAGWCEHGERFAAQVSVGPILGVQFH